jgi:hypothetical protein
VLVVDCEDARVHDCTKGYFDAFVDGLGAEDTRSSNFVVDFSGLIENEGQNVLVVRNSNDGLQNKLARSDNSCPSGAVVPKIVSTCWSYLSD